jgi:DNA mismatch repair ATPase MutS
MTSKIYDNLEMSYIFDRLNVYTPYGTECKKNMKSFLREEAQKLLNEYELIEKAVNLIKKNRYAFVDMRNMFKHIKDLRGSFKRISDNQVLSTVELYEIKSFVFFLKDISTLLEKIKWNMPKELVITSMPQIEKLLDPQNSGVNTFYVYDSYSKSLAKVRDEIKSIESEIYRQNKIIREEVQKDLGIKIRPNGEVSINKNDMDLLGKVDRCPNLTYSSETYMNITYKVKIDSDKEQDLKKINDLKLLEEEEEFNVRKRLSMEIKKYLDIFYDNISAIGKIDLLIAKGYLAIGTNSVKPEIAPDERLYIKNGRHIKVADTLRKQEKEFTPISVDLKRGVTCITGANMGGKTISLKLVGVLCAMAQYGLFVPADTMIFSMKDYIFFSLGDLQSTDKGLSTFGAEILEVKNIIDRSNENGLLLIDELARGTNPQEGFAISKALIDYMKDKESITIITSHFDGLTKDSDVYHLQVKGLVGVDMKKLKTEIENSTNVGIEIVHKYMDYRLIEVNNEEKVPRDAINIARLMGLQEHLIKEAEKYLT